MEKQFITHGLTRPPRGKTSEYTNFNLQQTISEAEDERRIRGEIDRRRVRYTPHQSD